MSDQNGFLDDVPLHATNYVATPIVSANTYYTKKEVSTTSGGNGCPLGVWICLGVVSVILIVLVLSSVGVFRSTNNQQALNTLFAEWHQATEERNSHAESATRMITLDGESQYQRSATLCGIQTFHKDPGDSLYRPLTTETIAQLVKNHTFNHVNSRLQLSIITANAVEETSKSKKERAQLKMTYNITSTLLPPSFTSVRLEELEFNTRDQSLGALRTIVLCSSSDPQSDILPCDAFITKRRLFSLHGEDSVSFSASKKTVKEEQTINLLDNDDLRTLRMYNIVFYHSAQPETPILTTEPIQC